MGFRVQRPRDRGLVVFSPLPPARNGIADYCAELMPALAAGRETWLVIDDHAPPPEVPAGCCVLRLATYASEADRFASLPHLYQLGNNADHVYMLPWLARRPGVVVLHDISLHHLFDQATLRWDDRDAYDAMLEAEHGEPGRRLAAAFRLTRRRPRAMFYELPMTRQILAHARAVVVHSLYAALKVQAQRPGVPVIRVRHHVTPAALAARQALSRPAARAALGVADDTVLLVSLGFVTKAKQVDAVLRFLARQRHTGRRLRYVIAGQDQPEDYDVRSLIASLGLGDVVQITGYVDERGFYRHVRAADVVVNLRYPSGGETSGTLIRALGAGACVLVNDIGPFSEFPDAVCAKVPMHPGRYDAEFERKLTELIDSPALRRRLGEEAARYTAERHSLARSAARYAQALEAHGGSAPTPPWTQSATLPPARIETLLAALTAAERGALPAWATRVPVPAATKDGPGSVLCLGVDAAAVSWLQRLFGHPAAVVDHRPGPLPPPWRCGLPPRSYGFVLVQLNLPDPATTLPPWLVTLNAALAPQGTLLLTTGLLPSGAAAKATVARLLVAAGFVVEAAAAQRDEASFALDCLPGAPDEPADVVWYARKVTDAVLPDRTVPAAR
jgi:glycosyltransferase involved in cell wall biosynthesis